MARGFQFIKKHVLEISLFLLLFLFIFSDFILFNQDYNIGYDIKNHFVPFYTEFKRLLGSGEMPFWSFNFFLGTNMIASKSYYFISDFFAYLIFLFHNMDILDVMLIMQFGKCLLSFILMNVLLKEFKLKKTTRILFSILYSFSSFTMIFLGIPMFLTFSTFLPLLFISIERYLRKGKLFLIALSSFILICSSYYLFWSVSIFLIFYWPIRYFLYHEFTASSFKLFLIQTFKAALLYLLGALLYAPILIPTVEYMLNNSRVTADTATSVFWSKRIYLDMFIKAISSPFYVNTDISNYFGSSYYRTDQIALFTSSLTVLLLPQLFSLKNKKQRNLMLSFYGICFFLLLFESGGSLMHGFSEASFRWTLLIILCSLITTAVLYDQQAFDIRILLATLTAILIGVLTVFLFVGNPLDYPEQTSMILLSLGFFVIYTLLLIFHKKIRYASWLIVSLVLIETAITGKITLQGYLNNDRQDSYQYDDYGIPTTYFEELQSKYQDEFYRIYISQEYVDIDHEKDFNYNSNMMYNFKGVYGYDSTYQTSIDDFLNWTGQYFWWFSESYYEILDFLSVKYYVVKSSHELPHENFTFIEQIAESEYLLYENEQMKPFGFTCNTLTTTEGFYAYTYEYDIYSLISNTLIIDQSIIERDQLQTYVQEGLPSVSFTDFIASNNHLEGRIEVSQKQLLLITIPYDRGWRITVDGQKVEPILANGGFMAIPLEEGNHTIEMNFTPYGWNFGLLVSICCGSFLAGIFLYEFKKKRRLTY